MGVTPDNTAFDVNITMDINTVLSTLNQLGFGPLNGMILDGYNTEWAELMGGRTNAEFVKTYVYQKTKLLFDPPINSAALNALKECIAENEWRITAL